MIEPTKEERRRFIITYAFNNFGYDIVSKKQITEKEARDLNNDKLPNNFVLESERDVINMHLDNALKYYLIERKLTIMGAMYVDYNFDRLGL